MVDFQGADETSPVLRCGLRFISAIVVSVALLTAALVSVPSFAAAYMPPPHPCELVPMTYAAPEPPTYAGPPPQYDVRSDSALQVLPKKNRRPPAVWGDSLQVSTVSYTGKL